MQVKAGEVGNQATCGGKGFSTNNKHPKKPPLEEQVVAFSSHGDFL